MNRPTDLTSVCSDTWGVGVAAILSSTTPATLQACASALAQCSQGGFLISGTCLL